jgi:hypothetical protein
MAGLPQELIARCHETMLRCGEFDNLQSLRAVFVTRELEPYQGRLPEGQSKAERIGLTIDYLRFRLSDRRPVLLLFLAALRDRYPKGDALRDDLEMLHLQVQQALGHVETIEVPFVVAAMNHGEVAALKKEKDGIFDDPTVAPIERIQFQQLEALLKENWILHYKQNREDWRPHTCQDGTIGAVVGEIFAHINQCEREPNNLPMLTQKSFSEDFFLPGRQAEAWDYLQQSGGLLIIDAVSLFHPTLRHALVQSTLTSDDNIAVLVISPSSLHRLPVNDLIETLISERLKMTFSRFAERLDSRCEVGAGDLIALQRWLFAALPGTAEFVQKQKIVLNRRVVREEAPQKPRGIGRAIFMSSEASDSTTIG